jgi:hypothetical protein
VQAYWVGNELLDSVEPADLARHVDERFRGRVGRMTEHLLETVAAGAVPHHSFHVFAVYPWLGLLRTGIVEEPLYVLDRCRVTPALVLSVSGDRAVVRLRPLRWNGRTLELDAWTSREVSWRDDGLSLVAPTPGDWVSLHWDFVCDRLTPDEARRLDRTTRRALIAVDSSASTAAALA